MRLLAICAVGSFLVLGRFCQPSPPTPPTPTPTPPPQVTLSSVTANFHTTSNDKDDNTKLDVTFKKNDGTIIADSIGNTGHYNNGTDKPIPLNIHGTHNKNELSGSQLALHIAP